tara:strand:+ start:598 stop:840 length:243 start_codon:yes stop_codon:yes gene_type:complete
MDHEKIRSILEANFQDSKVILTNSDCNLTLTIVSNRFIGQKVLNRHKEVLSHLKECFSSGELHALSIKTFTKEEFTLGKA